MSKNNRPKWLQINGVNRILFLSLLAWVMLEGCSSFHQNDAIAVEASNVGDEIESVPLSTASYSPASLIGQIADKHRCWAMPICAY